MLAIYLGGAPVSWEAPLGSLKLSFEECFARPRIGGLVVSRDQNISIMVFS